MSILENAEEVIAAQKNQMNVNNPGIAVYRIDYTLKHVEWKANIAAYSAEEAQNYLQTLFNNNAQIKSVGMETRLDAITHELRDTIIKGAKRKPGRPKKK